MRNSSPRSKRGLPAAQAGTSVIAAIALAAILGGIVLGFNALQSASANPQSQGAQAAAAAPEGSSDQICKSGMDYDYGFGGTCLTGNCIKNPDGLYPLLVPAAGPIQLTPITTCLSDADATTYIQNKFQNGTAPATFVYPSAGTVTDRISCTNGAKSTQSMTNLCTYIKQADGTYKIQNWMCRTRFYDPNLSGYPDQECRTEDVPLNGKANLPPPGSPTSVGSGGGTLIITSDTASTPDSNGCLPNGINTYTNQSCTYTQTTCQPNGTNCTEGSSCTTDSGVAGTWSNGMCVAGATSQCGAGQTSVNGTCTSVVQPPCPTGWYQVNNQCMDAATAADACSSGSQGACAALNVSNPYCPSGNYDSFGSCVTSTSVPPAGQFCVDQNGNKVNCPQGIPPGTNICSNGAVNPPQCDNSICGTTCPAGQTPGPNCTCVLANSCTNGATNPPTCNNNSQGQPCTNGATNPPACNNRQQQTQQQPPQQQQPRTSTFPQQQTQPQIQNPQQQNCSGLSSIFGGCSSQQSQVSCQLQVSPNPVQQGLPATLQWTTSGSVYSAQVSNVGNVPVPSGSYSVYPTGSQNYSMTVVDQYGNQNTCNANATVTPRQNTNPTTNPNQNPTAQNPYGTGTNGQPCQQPPAQPTSSSCNVGSMQPTVSNGCTTGYQCVPNGSTSSGQTPSPQISCQPQIADVGTSVAISYSCGNSTDSTGQGFATNDQTSGSATAMIAPPPAGTNTASYGITCINNNAQSSGGAAATASAQCSIQLNAPSIVLVANPSSIPSGSESSIGWVTAGMKSCVASSPTDTAFTQDNATNLDVNGMAQTSSITQTTEYDLTCTSIGGTTKTASVKVAAN